MIQFKPISWQQSLQHAPALGAALHHGPCCIIYCVNYHCLRFQASYHVSWEIAHLLGPDIYSKVPGRDVFPTSEHCLSQALGNTVSTHVTDATKAPGTHPEEQE